MCWISFSEVFLHAADRRDSNACQAMKTNQRDTSWLQLRLVLRIVALAFFIAMVIGLIMAWIFYFRVYDSTFAALRAEELRLAQEIYDETTSRVLADMVLSQEQAAQNASLAMDIAMREAEQAFVNASLQSDIEARISGDAAIAQALAIEIMERIGNDTLIQYEINNETTVIETIEAFDAYSTQQFFIIEGNISSISEALSAEIAARIAAQAALQAADLIIEADLVLLIAELTAEVNARIAQDNLINLKLHLITTSLLRTIDNQLPIADNMVFESLSASVVIANGVPSNQITLTQTALLSLSGVTADASGNIGLVGVNGLTVTLASPTVVQIGYSGPAPPAQMNHAVLTAVYPFPIETQWIQNAYGQNLNNGFAYASCNSDTDCSTSPRLGNQWTCSSSFPTSANGKRCVNNQCNGDESQCYDLLGQPWHCRNNMCVQDFCVYDQDCNDAYGPNSGWFCVNYGCARGQENSPYLPIFTDSYPYGAGPYQPVTQPDSSGSPDCTGCIFPQAGAYNDNSIYWAPLNAYPFVYGNRRPFDPIMTYAPFRNTQECIFDVAWEGEHCGFIMPGAGTYIVQITVNIRVGINQPVSLIYGRLWFYMHIDRSGSSTPQWEKVDSDYLAINNPCSGCVIGQSYVTMSTTLSLSSATPSSSMTEPIAPGTRVYAGWSAYMDHSVPNPPQYVTWYSIVYEITQVA